MEGMRTPSDTPQAGEIRRFGGGEMAWIPPGSFLMGAPKEEWGAFDDEKPQHPVTLREGFWVGVVPVTQELWAGITGQRPRAFGGEDLPVVWVTWCDAVLFANLCSQREGLSLAYELPLGFAMGMSGDLAFSLNAHVRIRPDADGYRLPTEAQWEYAARAGTTTRYWSGDTEEDLARVGWYDENATRPSHPVGQKPANPWGLKDIHGNVYEWCFDAYDARAYSPESAGGRPPPGGDNRVFRGGSWHDDLIFARAAARCAISAGGCRQDSGLRLVRPAATGR